MSETVTPAGWYTDPEMAGTLRYWDGVAWTPHRSPHPAVGIPGSNTAMWSHLGPLVAYGLGMFTFGIFALLAWVVPLVILSGQTAKTSAFVRSHAVESLNFQLSQLIYSIVAAIPIFLFVFATFGFGLILLIPLLIAVVVFFVVVMIKASMAASAGQQYRYPLTIRFVR